MDEQKVLEKLKSHDKQFETVTDKLLEHDAKFDIVMEKLLEHDARFDSLENLMMSGFSDISNQNLTSHDQIMKLLTTMQHEIVATNHAIRRHEDRLNGHNKDIKTIKTVLKLS